MSEGLTRPSEAATDTLRAQSEMRLATAMLVDMVNSTAVSERIGPEASFLLLDELLGMARSVVAAHGGIMMEELGDGFFALFGAPVSIDRASLAASRAGLDICEAVLTKAEAFEAKFGVAPQLRVGLAAGEVLLTGSRADGTLRATGNAVNLAARLQTLAEPNGVVCSESVGLETEGWIRLEPMGPRELKGFAAPVEAFHVREILAGALAQPAAGRWRSGDFVGRTAEISQLTRWIDETGDRRPFSLIVGEAGIGKSRLTAEFAARLGQRRLVLGSCHPAATARPLAPLIEILRNYARWRPGQAVDRDPDRRDLEAILPAGQAGTDLLLRLIEGHVSQEAEADASEAVALREALTVALIGLGRLPDCLMAIEDLHWIDPLSAEVLVAVLGAASDRFRMLGTTRPVDWLARLPKDRIEMIEAGPMQAPEIGAIARTVMGASADAALAEKVAQDSEGNPFFAIEILHNVAARGAAVEAGRIGPIQNVALARFDRLDAATRTLLRMASVQGRTFRRDVLACAAGADRGEVDGLFDAAEGIVEPDPSDPEGSGRFHHILLRDSIYATIPSTARSDRHLAVAQALESCTGDAVHLVADQLADHYELAGDTLNAVKYLRIAAGNAYGLYALESCKSLLERAFRLIHSDLSAFPVEMLEDAVSLRMRCLDVLDQFRAVIDVSEAWLPRLRTPDGSPTLALLLALTGKAYCHMAEFERSHAFVTEALDMATRHGHDRAIAYAKVALMRVLSDSRTGTLKEVERLHEETRAFAEGLSDGALYANRMFHMMSAYRTLGMMRRAKEVNDEVRDFGARHNQLHVQLVADWNESLNAIVTNDFRTGLALADAGLVKSVRNSAVWEVFMLLKQSAQMGLGRDSELETIRRIRDSSDRRGEFTTRDSAATQLGYALCASGRIRSGWRQLRRSDARVHSAAQLVMRRFQLLHRAEFLLMLGGLIAFDGPRPRLGLADLPVAIYLRLTARRQAKALLRRLLSQVEGDAGLFVARAHAALAVIAAAEGQCDAARDGFARAEALMRAEGLTTELDRLAALRAAQT